MFEIIGTIAFAISGALIAMQKKLDLFGVVTLSVVTAIGGGILRDVFIGNIPPTAFMQPKYFLVSIGTALCTFLFYPIIIRFPLLPASRNGYSMNFYKIYMEIKLHINLVRMYKRIFIIRNVILVFDAIGLGVFTALGASTAIEHNFNNVFIVVCMGLISGVGGGMLRDVFVRDIPLILKKDIYALASVIGAVVLYYSYNYISHIGSLYICFFITFILRILSIKYNLNLPAFNIKSQKLKYVHGGNVKF
jgi:uncharacterized membrane protein YeiH